MNGLSDIVRPAGRELERVEAVLRSCLSSSGEAVRGIERHTIELKGKRIRPAVTLLSGALAGELTEKNVNLAVAAELVHMATLVHDDVIDGARMRRGRATVNTSWGNPVAVLFGDYLLSHAFGILCRFRENRVLPAMARMTRLVCEGEIFQLRRLFDTRMSESDYRRMASLKTASLFSTCCRLSAALSGASPDVQEALEKFGDLFGTAYQIVDDCHDLTVTGGDKDSLKDLDGGRVTLPIIKALAMLSREERDRFARAFKEGDIEFCRKRILSSGAVAASFSNAEEIMKQARDRLSLITDCPARQSLNQLTEFVIVQGQA